MGSVFSKASKSPARKQSLDNIKTKNVSNNLHNHKSTDRSMVRQTINVNMLDYMHGHYSVEGGDLNGKCFKQSCYGG